MREYSHQIHPGIFDADDLDELSSDDVKDSDFFPRWTGGDEEIRKVKCTEEVHQP